MTRTNRLLILCLTIGCILIAVGLIVGMPSASVEGAYFDQVNGAPKFAGVFSAASPSLLDPADGSLWLGAGIVLILVPVCGAIGVRLRSASTASLPESSTRSSADQSARRPQRPAISPAEIGASGP